MITSRISARLTTSLAQKQNYSVRFFSSSILNKAAQPTTASAPPAEIEVFVDGKPVKIAPGSAIIQACEKAGVTVPRFCYHDRLGVAGNCRMCLVQLDKVPKLQASCAVPVAPNMKILTDTPRVQKARESVMEFLLSNHPLDCPICDQGGECDLQDQSVRYGSDRSRYSEPAGKRAVEDKNLGPLVKTCMTRCIQCTRCVRFANEVAGASELGTSGRGNDMQIGTYIEKTISSEMSGNLVDLCPVGALTSKPYSYNARPWELRKTESIDVLDAVGSNIRVDTRGTEVLRILPKANDNINEEWISDKTRYAYDGLKRQRLANPLIKQDGEFLEAAWPNALETIAEKIRGLKSNDIQVYAGSLSDAESLVALKDLANSLGSENLNLDTPGLENLPAGFTTFSSNYLLDATIRRIEESDAILLVGTDPRHEAPIVNTRIRKAFLYNKAEIGVIGEKTTLNYENTYLGDSADKIDSVLSSSFGKVLSSAKKPLILVGSGVIENKESSAILSSVAKLSEKLQSKVQDASWSVYNLLQRDASHAAAFDIGYSIKPANKNAKFVYLLGADDIDPNSIPKDAFVVYQGHHGDVGASIADVVLPGAAYTEKSATYVNTEGTAQTTRAALGPLTNAREDWKIIRALSEVVGVDLYYDDISGIRSRMAEISPNLVEYNVPHAARGKELNTVALESLKQTEKSKLSAQSKLINPIKDFYLTDPISRSSVTMANCSREFSK